METQGTCMAYRSTPFPFTKYLASIAPLQHLGTAALDRPGWNECHKIILAGNVGILVGGNAHPARSSLVNGRTRFFHFPPQPFVSDFKMDNIDGHLSLLADGDSFS